eukprot:1459257-Pleurochrysis_carterae.AAC.2
MLGVFARISVGACYAGSFRAHFLWELSCAVAGGGGLAAVRAWLPLSARPDDHLCGQEPLHLEAGLDHQDTRLHPRGVVGRAGA